MKKFKLLGAFISAIALIGLTGCDGTVTQDSITKRLPGYWQHISCTVTEGGQSGTESYEAENIVYEFQEDGQFINPFGGWGIWEVENDVLIIRNSGFGSKPEKRNVKGMRTDYGMRYTVKKITNTTLQLYYEDKAYSSESVLYTFRRK